MPSAIYIRLTRPDDYAVWLPLWNGYNRFYGRFGDSALPLEVTQTTWGRFHDTAEPMHAFLAEMDGKIVGFVHCIFHRTTISKAPTCYLQDLFVEEDVRGMGVARKLIECVYEHAKAEGSVRVYWLTHSTNAPAILLYDKVAEKSGFLQYRKTLD